MARKSTLLAALDAHKGKDYKLEKQKSLQKAAAKRKRIKAAAQKSTDDTGSEPEAVGNDVQQRLGDESEGWESDHNEGASMAVRTTTNIALSRMLFLHQPNYLPACLSRL